MLIGADSKVESLDMVIKNTQKQLDDMKAGKGAAMGIGRESADKDMLRLSSYTSVTSGENSGSTGGGGGGGGSWGEPEKEAEEPEEDQNNNEESVVEVEPDISDNSITNNVGPGINDDQIFQEVFNEYIVKPEDVIHEVDRPTGWLAEQIENAANDYAGRGLTDEELYLSVNNPLAAVVISENQSLTDEYVSKYFDNHVDGNNANAFRHAMFTALNSIALGGDLAAQFANAHENIVGNDSRTQVRGGCTNYQHMEMDIHNNAVGIALGTKMLATSYNGFVNYDDLAEMVYDVVITQGAGEWIIE